MAMIDWKQFEAVEIRVGRIVEVQAFPQARNPAWILHVDFGETLGVKKSSAQITDMYDRDDLIGRLVAAVVNFPPKQIGPIRSECLVTGFHDESGRVILCVPDGEVPLGSRLL
jgi:tRNA-binding protein